MLALYAKDLEPFWTQQIQDYYYFLQILWDFPHIQACNLHINRFIYPLTTWIFCFFFFFLLHLLELQYIVEIKVVRAYHFYFLILISRGKTLTFSSLSIMLTVDFLFFLFFVFCFVKCFKLKKSSHIPGLLKVISRMVLGFVK